jgi:hypothetical protein
MADGSFPTLVSKDTGANAVANPIFVELSDGTSAITITGGAINVTGTVTIDDLRAGTAAGEDNVLIFANTVKDGSGTDYVPLVDADGRLIISNLPQAYEEDAVAADPATGPTLLAERDDALAGITPAEGDWSKVYVNANGALWVTMDGSVTIADGGNSITVDASDLDIRNLTLADDAVKVSANSTANGVTNPIYVSVVEGAIASSTEVHDYGTTVDTGNNDYTVTGTTFLLRSVIFAASGGMKAEVQVGPIGTLVTKAVGFIPHQGGTEQLFFDPPIEVPVASTGTVRVIMTNREGAAQSVYSTIIGNNLP